MSKGLFLGKFMPPHKGHLFVCDVARRCVDHLTILVCSHDAEPIDGHLRAAWMRECAERPASTVIHMHRTIPQEPREHPEFWNIWKDAIFEHHSNPIDVVFGSEPYIYKLAETLGAKPFIIDAERSFTPVSATAIRKNPKQNWAFIPSPVRSFFQKKVTLIGPESSGKTTLSHQLADHFRTITIPEYGRKYDAGFRQGTGWTPEDFQTIANRHSALASAIAGDAGPLVVEDTDLLQTIVWSEALLGHADDVLIERLKQAVLPDMYLLLGPEMEWHDDGTRYHASETQRRWFHDRLKHWLEIAQASWREINDSSWAARRDHCLQKISSVLDLETHASHR